MRVFWLVIVWGEKGSLVVLGSEEMSPPCETHLLALDLLYLYVYTSGRPVTAATPGSLRCNDEGESWYLHAPQPTAWAVYSVLNVSDDHFAFCLPLGMDIRSVMSEAIHTFYVFCLITTSFLPKGLGPWCCLKYTLGPRTVEFIPLNHPVLQSFGSTDYSPEVIVRGDLFLRLSPCKRPWPGKFWEQW